jgi:glutamyl-tRNA synthetase
VALSARARFAPSPTGPPHLGSMRTALFNWLLARSTGGQFILRIEDTDLQRFDPQAEEQMLDALHWLGLEWDEGPGVGGPHAPYRQSERLAYYRQAADVLIEAGDAYRCTCSPERVAQVQARLRALGRPAVYDGHCRDLGIGPTDTPHVVRFRVPHQGQTTIHDALHGDVTFDNRRLPGDIVLLKSDGFPTYHLALVVDDHAMRVSHVLRGDEWLPSTPLHVLLYRAFGWEPPEWVHLPLVTDRASQKIKKRDPSFQVEHYRRAGYLPEAVVNYLALLGWHPGIEEEVFTLDDLVARFSLDRLNASPSVFDEGRLRWFNRQHVARLPDDELVARCIPLIRGAYPQAAARDDAWLARLVVLVRDEIALLADVVGSVAFAFRSPGELTREAHDALVSEPARPVLEALAEALGDLDMLDGETGAGLLRDLRVDFKRTHGWDGRMVMFPVRAALTGDVRGPHLSDVMALLGRDECLKRVGIALDQFKQGEAAYGT